MLILFHRTTQENARAILTTGFKDGVGNYLTCQLWTGVWFSDVPLDVNEGAKGDALLEIALDLAETDISEYEWVEEGKPYREWLIPAGLLNSRMHPRLMTLDEEFDWIARNREREQPE
jgi:hypothetical protein